MTAIDYETDTTTGRGCRSTADFAQWTRDAAAYREQARAEKRAELGRHTAPARGRRSTVGAAGAPTAPLALLSPWRLLALASSRRNSVICGRPQCAWRDGAVAGLRPVPAGVGGDDRRSTAPGLPVRGWRRLRRPMLGLRPFGRRTSRAAMLATDWTALDPAVPRFIPAAYSVRACSISRPYGLSMNQTCASTPPRRAGSPLFWPAQKAARSIPSSARWSRRVPAAGPHHRRRLGQAA